MSFSKHPTNESVNAHHFPAESIDKECMLNDGSILHTKTFDKLTVSELYNLLHIRSDVFIVEQNCVYQDIDFNDQTAIHLWISRDDKIMAQLQISVAYFFSLGLYFLV